MDEREKSINCLVGLFGGQQLDRTQQQYSGGFVIQESRQILNADPGFKFVINFNFSFIFHNLLANDEEGIFDVRFLFLKG